jgi:hypothetical protein
LVTHDNNFVKQDKEITIEKEARSDIEICGSKAKSRITISKGQRPKKEGQTWKRELEKERKKK